MTMKAQAVVGWPLLSALFLLSSANAQPKAPVWDVTALNCTPAVYKVELPCDDSGKPCVPGVRPVFIEGEPWRGKPTRIFAWWGLPAGASAEKKVPAMVLVHGGNGTAFASWVKTWNGRGYAAIAMDTCGGIPQGKNHGRLRPRHPWSGPSGWESSFAHTDDPIADQWTYHAVAAVMRCHSFLRSQPEVDALRIGLTGISWGGYLVSIVGSVDSRFRFVAPVYGCGFYDRSSVWSGDTAKDKERIQKWCDLWDAKNFFNSAAAKAKIPFLWCCGTNDQWYPLDCVRASYGLLDPSVPLRLAIKYRMAHGHPPAGDPPEISAMAAAYLKGGRPLVEITSAELEKGVLRATFDPHGRKVVRAELLCTCSTNAVLASRKWTVAPVADFDATGRFSAPVPSAAVMLFANVVTDNGLVASTRVFEP